MDRLLTNNNYYCNVQSSRTVENGASEQVSLLLVAFAESPLSRHGIHASSFPCATLSMRTKLFSYIYLPKHFLPRQERQSIFGLLY